MPSSSSFTQLLKNSRVLGHQHTPESLQHQPWASLELQVDVSFSRAFQRLHSAVERKEVRLRQLLNSSRQRARDWLAALPTTSGILHHQPEQQTLNQMHSQTQELQGPGSQLIKAAASLTQQQAALDQAPASSLSSSLDELLGTNGWLRHTVLSSVAHLSHAFMHGANSVRVEGGEIMQAALARPAGQALITVCNHVAALDDPLVVSTVIPPELYSQPSAIRWTLCATDRCFKYAALAPFFTAAKVLPVQRGAGLHQPGMQAAELRLAAGDWVHIFPEGTRSRDPEQLGPVRKGVGRLVAAAAAAAPAGTPPPLVVPFVHMGMQKVLPVGSKLPQFGQEVRVVVGQPIPVDDLLSRAAALGWADDVLYSAIASRVEQRLQAMHASLWHNAQDNTLSTAMDVTAEERPVSTSSGVAGRGVVDSGQQQGQALGGSWGTVGQQVWDHMAFSIWHRVWSARATIARLSEEAHTSGLPLGLWGQEDHDQLESQEPVFVH